MDAEIALWFDGREEGKGVRRPKAGGEGATGEAGGGGGKKMPFANRTTSCQKKRRPQPKKNKPRRHTPKFRFALTPGALPFSGLFFNAMPRGARVTGHT